MELTSEDTLRLHVLLAGKPLAIRIDASAMVVFGLTQQGEAKVPLNPIGREEPYLRKVKELLSGHVLGSPGGYPVYLQRWTRMGQMREESLEQLLLLGEPEAVVAAVCALGLTDELARRAWWAMPEAENARRMLANQAVVKGVMGKILAAYLVEYLPFETEPETMIDSVRLVLQPTLLDEVEREGLWKKAARRSAYYAGFLMATPDRLFAESEPRSDVSETLPGLQRLAAEGYRPASLLLKVCSGSGQAFIATCMTVLKKPSNQEVVTRMLEVLANYFKDMRPEPPPELNIEELLEEAQVFCGETEQIRECTTKLGEQLPEWQAMRVLSGMGYAVVRPVFRDTTAIGSLMRRKLEPVMQPIMRQLEILQGKR